MFSGIVDHTGILKSIEQKPKGLLFRIQTQFTDFVLGESIAVDGVCLTVVNSSDNTFDCELSPETLKLTIAKTYNVGRTVNLERAMRLNDRIGGHLVTGHVDKTLCIDHRILHDEFIELRFTGFSEEDRAFLIKKGCVAINGVSLTVNTVNADYFSVMLIPHTLERTSLSTIKPGQRVNIEWDYVAKLILNNAGLINERQNASGEIQYV